MEINRQYIGARYVPKFYEGTNGTEWDSNVTYEPLTIVTYLSNSYTSKKSVPAAVGDPIHNPEYWASTGNYNAQVEAYRQEVLGLHDDVADVVTALGELAVDLNANGVLIPSEAKIKQVGTTEYPTIKAVTDSIEAGDFTIILIPPSTTSMQNYYAPSEYPQGYLFPENTYIVGLGGNRENVIIGCAFSAMNNDYSAINCQGNFGLYNVSLNTFNARYAIHDDFGTEKWCTRIFKNCHIKSSECYYHSVGGGLRGYNHVVYENCLIEATGSNCYDALFYHNSNYDGHASIKFIGCTFHAYGNVVTSDVSFSCNTDATSNSIDTTFESSSCHSVAVSIGAGSKPIFIHSDTDIPILFGYDYQNASMPRFEELWVGTSGMSLGQIVEIGSVATSVVPSSDPSNGYGVISKLDSVNNFVIIVRFGSYCSCTELNLAAPSATSKIYVQSNGTIGYTATSSVIGVAYRDGTARLYTRPVTA